MRPWAKSSPGSSIQSKHDVLRFQQLIWPSQPRQGCKGFDCHKTKVAAEHVFRGRPSPPSAVHKNARCVHGYLGLTAASMRCGLQQSHEHTPQLSNAAHAKWGLRASTPEPQVSSRSASEFCKTNSTSPNRGAQQRAGNGLLLFVALQQRAFNCVLCADFVAAAQAMQQKALRDIGQLQRVAATACNCPLDRNNPSMQRARSIGRAAMSQASRGTRLIPEFLPHRCAKAKGQCAWFP